MRAALYGLAIGAWLGLIFIEHPVPRTWVWVSFWTTALIVHELWRAIK